MPKPGTDRVSLSSRDPCVLSLGAVVLAYTALVVYSQHSLYATPLPGTLESPSASFSEARAMQHVQYLAALPERQVGSSGAKDAVQYLLQQARQVQDLALSAGRTNLTVQVDVEQYSGAFYQKFMSRRITNSYQNIDAVILRLTPVGSEDIPGVLVGGHFDSTLGTPGASDCASCVGVALEAARTITSDTSIQLAAPLVFLLNGGEETFSQGAAGFINSSKWAKGIGAFINLESTGSGGPAVVFQATGDWTVGAFSRVAPHPRGTVVAQDCFDMDLIPADSDYSLWSAQKHGHLPGLDVAFLLDASSYHTHQDTPDRIRPGTMQAMGENVVQAAQEFARVLAEQHQGSKQDASLATPVYFDILGKVMVHYSAAAARRLHTIPLGALLAILSCKHLGLSSSLQVPSLSLLARYTAFAFVPALTTLLVPAFVGVLRVLVFGNPMVWFAHDLTAYAMLVPAAIAGMLLPYTWWPQGDVRWHAQGNVAGAALSAAALAQLGAGTAFLPALWSLAALPPAFLLPRAGFGARHGSAIALAVPLVLVCMPNGIALSLVMVQRASMMGVMPAPFARVGCDALLGAVMGATVLATLGLQAPWIAGACGRRLQAAVTLLLLFSAAVSALASMALQPYTPESPKHLFLAHFVRHDAVHELGSTYELAGMDTVPTERALAGLPHVEYTRGNVSTWQVLHPAAEIMQPVSLLAPHPGPRPHAQLPAVRLMREEVGGAGRGSRRLHVELRLPAAGAFGSMNVSGPVAGWSLPPGALQDVGPSPQPHWKFVRFAGNEGSEVWPLWFDLVGPHPLRLELWVAYHHSQADWAGAHYLSSEFADWAATAVILVYHSAWQL